MHREVRAHGGQSVDEMAQRNRPRARSCRRPAGRRAPAEQCRQRVERRHRTNGPEGPNERVADLIGVDDARELRRTRPCRIERELRLPTCTASRVLPTPPTPVSVTSVAVSMMPTIRATSALSSHDRRPLQRQIVAVGVEAAHGRECAGRSGWSTCQIRSGSVRSRSRCSPRSTASTGPLPVTHE